MSKDCDLGRVSKMYLMKGMFVRCVKLCSENLFSNTTPSHRHLYVRLTRVIINTMCFLMDFVVWFFWVCSPPP